MTPNKSQAIGADAEEALRSYFWRAGFFALRGVPVRLEGEDVTDIDIWLYERPTGVARGTQFVDAKNKGKPKAFERILWSLGVAKALELDRAYVATTDVRPAVRRFAKKVGVGLIDGRDLSRIRDAYGKSGWITDYLSEEELMVNLRKLDASRKIKIFADLHSDVKSVGSGKLSAGSLIRSLGYFGEAGRLAIHEYSQSEAAAAATRLTYLAASMCSLGLDWVSAEAYFRSSQEKRDHLISAIRFGQSDPEEGMKPFRTAVALINRYAPKSNAGKTIQTTLATELDEIPAEIIVDASLKHGRGSQLFDTARELGEAAFSRNLPDFDSLTAPTKSLLGAMLDYSRIKRETFATRWSSVTPSAASKTAIPQSLVLPLQQQSLGNSNNKTGTDD